MGEDGDEILIVFFAFRQTHSEVASEISEAAWSMGFRKKYGKWWHYHQRTLAASEAAIGQVDVAYVPNLRHPFWYIICVRSRARPNSEKGGRVYGVE